MKVVRNILAAALVVLMGLGVSAHAQDGVAVPNYLQDIQPIFNKRCVACHGCLGSPCNLKLTSHRAVERGGFGQNPYSIHLSAYPRTGMNVHQTTEEWREVGFYPVIYDKGPGLERLYRSLLYQMIEAGMSYNKPGFSRQAVMPIYSQRYKHLCPATPEVLKIHLTENPAGGMPFGLPALDIEEFRTLRAWITAGAPGPTDAELKAAKTVSNPSAVRAWEEFFNNTDKRSQLVARYIFEHVFLATIALDESPGDLFRLVRSKTPSGQAVEIIDTPLPYSNPYSYAGIDRFYYRLDKITTPIIQKNHFVWHLNQAEMDHLKELFLAGQWDETAKLDAPWDIGNPFKVFQAMPTEARYRFLLENSELIVSGITYGPVCLGQTATYAVKDQFWVYFVDPKHDVSVLEPKLGLETWDAFMDHLAYGNQTYEAAYGAALAKLRPKGYTIDAIWNGDRKNPNAWLTVLRHESNVSVLKGRQGGIPRTMWLMDYSGFERIYYDTVADFEYWSGDVSKIATLVFFNYLRQEFEDNFLLLLPEDERSKIRDDWTQGIGQFALDVMPFAGEDQPTQIETSAKEPLLSLLKQIHAHMGEAVSGPLDLLNPHVKPNVSLDDPVKTYDDWVKAASLLTQTRQYKFPRFLPSVTLLKLNDGEQSKVYSLVANRVYATQDTLFFQNGESLPDLYTMSIYPTIIGGFPNAILEFDLVEAGDFLRSLRDVQTLDDWNKLRDRYAVLRNSDRFWPIYDWFTQWNFTNRGIEAGHLDLSYFDLFDKVY
ncbi:MAG: fatty acid cis/trans isomerase [Pseudomonadota bacterium]